MVNDTNTHSETVERLLDIINWLGPQLLKPGLDADALRRLAKEASEKLHTVASPPDSAPLFAQADSLIDDLLSDFGKRQAAAAANNGIVGVRTGLHHLDETLNGLEPGKLYMLAAMPGMGKTTLALQWAATVAAEGSTALYLSLENDSLDLARKLACRLGQVSYSASLKGKLSRQEWAEAVSRLGKLHGRLFLSTPRASMPDLPTLVDGFKERTGAAPALIVVDYLQAWVKRMATSADTSDIRERIDRFAPQLREIGERYGCAVLAISAQNRANYTNGGMAAMKESGDLEYNADAIMTLCKDDDKKRLDDLTRDPRTIPLKLTVDKNRQGLVGTPIKLLLDGDYCMIDEEGR